MTRPASGRGPHSWVDLLIFVTETVLHKSDRVISLPQFQVQSISLTTSICSLIRSSHPSTRLQCAKLLTLTMSTLMPWRGFALVSTIILISYLVFQTLTVSGSTSSTESHEVTESTTTTTTQTELHQNVPNLAQKFSGTLSENDGWATRPLSEKGGLLWVQYNETFQVTWGISMFHALHCVEMLRMSLTGGPMAHSGSGEDSTAPMDEEGNDTNHLSHCLDYIAQVSTH